MILFAVSFQTCEHDFESKPDFVYNKTTGNCENAGGMTGFNAFDISEIRKSKKAECLDLSGQELIYLMDTANIQDFKVGANNTMEGYNFRGSKFDGAKLFRQHC